MQNVVRRWRGFVKAWQTCPWTRIALVQRDGYKIDLITRIQEAVNNYGTKVAVRYWTCDSDQPDEQIEEGAIRTIIGALNASFEEHSYSYSEWTSGVDYDTEFTVGGHNIMNELLSHSGKWLVIEVEFLDQPNHSGELMPTDGDTIKEIR